MYPFFRCVTRRLFLPFSTIAAATQTILSEPNDSENAADNKTDLRVPYLLVGGGTAAHFAALTIRAREPDARVLIVGEESIEPYQRCYLCKEFWWYGDARTSTTFSYYSPASHRRRYATYEAEGFYPPAEALFGANANGYPHGAISMMRGTRVRRIDVKKRVAQLDDGRWVHYEKCLIATGLRPQNLSALSASELADRVSLLYTMEDYQRLASVMDTPSSDGRPKQVVVVGGGLLGTELVFSLQRRYGSFPKKDPIPPADSSASPSICLIQVTPDPQGLLAEMLPRPLSEYVTQQMRKIGVEIRTGYEVSSAKRSSDGRLKLMLKSRQGEEQVIDDVDYVIVDAGAEPNVELARESGIPLDEKLGGIHADSEFRVDDTLWAAGAVCAFEDPTLRMRRRVDYMEHAEASGRFAGANMTGAHKTCTHQSSFSMPFGKFEHMEGVGHVDVRNSDTITYFIGDEKSDNHENENPIAVVFYLSNDDDDRRENDGARRVLGILFVNVYNSVAMLMARRILADARRHTPKELRELIKVFRVFTMFEADDEEDAEKSNEEREEEKSEIR